MAEKPARPAAAKEGEPAPKKKLPIKVIGAVAVLMVLEGIGLFVVLGMTGPAKSEAHTAATELVHDDGELTSELEIVSEKFQNLQTGRVWIWDVAIFVQAKNKNLESVEEALGRRNAEIKEGVSQIISRAQHAQLKEPERQTLNRQLTGYFQELFGTGADDKPLVERVLIPKCRGFPADF